MDSEGKIKVKPLATMQTITNLTKSPIKGTNNSQNPTNVEEHKTTKVRLPFVDPSAIFWNQEAKEHYSEWQQMAWAQGPKWGTKGLLSADFCESKTNHYKPLFKPLWSLD